MDNSFQREIKSFFIANDSINTSDDVGITWKNSSNNSKSVRRLELFHKVPHAPRPVGLEGDEFLNEVYSGKQELNVSQYINVPKSRKIISIGTRMFFSHADVNVYVLEGDENVVNEIEQADLSLPVSDKVEQMDLDNVPDSKAIESASEQFNGSGSEQFKRSASGMLKCKLCPQQFFYDIALVNHLKIIHNYYDFDEGKIDPKGNLAKPDIGNPKNGDLALGEAPSSSTQKQQNVKILHRSYTDGADESQITDEEPEKKKKKKVSKRGHFECKICGKTFTVEGTYRGHMDDHKPKIFKCEHCPKAFSVSRKLAEHERIHMGDEARIYKCETCGKAFKRTSLLYKHRRIHMGEESKVFECDLCSKRFRIKSTMDRHRLTHFGAEGKTCPCPHCGKMFYTPARVKEHEKKCRSKGQDDEAHSSRYQPANEYPFYPRHQFRA